MFILAQTVISETINQTADAAQGDELTTLANSLRDAEVWKWGVAGGLLVGAWLLGVLISAVLRHQGRRLRQARTVLPFKAAHPLLGIVLDAISSPLTMFLIIIALWAGTSTVLL